MKLLYKPFVLLLMIVLLLASCDPARLLVVKVTDPATQSVTVYAQQKVLPSSNRTDSTRLILQVPYRDTSSRTFHYGIGNWPDEAVSTLASGIDSIVLVNGTSRTVLQTKETIEVYLKQHRHGFAGSVLKIEAK